MPVQITIADADLAGFSPAAQDRLRTATEDYAAALIAEANRIEAVHNISNSPPEITTTMVHDAVVVQRHGSSAVPVRASSKILRIIAALLALVVGIMANTTNLQDKFYLLLFIFLIAAAILTMTISIFKE